MHSAPPADSTPASAGFDGPLFLLGLPRSGTKLLRTLLAQHPRVRMLPWETDFLPYLAQEVARHGPPQHARDFARLRRGIGRAMYFRYRAGALGPFDAHAWQQACRTRDAAGLFEGFAHAELDVEPGSGVIWGDKSPSYIEHLGLLRTLFPQARCIHIVRDVRDQCLSLNEAYGKDMRRAAHRWSVGVQSVRAAESEGLNVRTVRFETLVNEPEPTLRDLCDFLGLDFVPNMLEPDAPVENLGSTRGQRGIVTASAGRYRRRLSAHQIFEIEAIAWDGMQAMGYTPDFARAPMPLGRGLLGRLRIRDGVMLVIRDVERRGLLRSAAAYLDDFRVKARSEIAR